jgi:hypothetical protein
MNVVNGSDAHDGIPLIGRRKSRMEKNTALVLTSFEMSKGKELRNRRWHFQAFSMIFSAACQGTGEAFFSSRMA